MLKQLLEENLITFEKSFTTWEEAIAGGAKRLVESGRVTADYIDAMIESVNTHGPYIVIAPNIAMPHSQLGANGVNDTSMALMIVEEPVSFEQGDPTKDARIFITIAAVDEQKHMDNIVAVANLFSNEPLVADLLESKTIADIENIVLKHNL